MLLTLLGELLILNTEPFISLHMHRFLNVFFFLEVKRFQICPRFLHILFRFDYSNER